MTLFFYYQGTNELEIESAILIVNAATKNKDWQWLTKNLTAKMSHLPINPLN